MDRSGAWIGGSDWGHVFSLPPYGCARQLWYEKTGSPPDYPKIETGAMTRGKRLEAIIAEEYVLATGRKIINRRRYPKPEISWLSGQPDRYIAPNGDGRGGGVLEAKSCGVFAYKKFLKEGLPEYYIMQLNHYLNQAKTNWGAWAILAPENWNFHQFEFNFDADLMDKMIHAGEKFIRQVENGPTPDRLDDAKDKRCAKCPYRTTCQGAEFAKMAEATGNEERKYVEVPDDELPSLLQRYNEFKDVADEAATEMEAIKNQINKKIDHYQAPYILSSGHRICRSSYIRNSIDTTRLKRDLPDIAAKYNKPATVSSLRIFPA